ncbi:hypothetical protein BJ878DRAFT_540734 [Calycina marina]|uniref:RNB domain-containing protein n=1 Tax=Calycina marina TaxID=1763456 RepID=A0A9P7Z5I3_9HELO|nr:hypothetical protein BJ878DRAFT_540734 [Calycina marina]
MAQGITRASKAGFGRYITPHFLVEENFRRAPILNPLPPIRDRLRRWEAENASSFKPVPELINEWVPGRVGNLIEIDTSMFRVDPIDTESDLSDTVYDGEAADVGVSRSFLRPGDMVDLSSIDGSQIELAIYIRDLDGHCQFYTMTGKLLHRRSKAVRFFVPGFVKPEELKELIPYLPDTIIPTAMEDVLQSLPQHVPRDTGRPLVLSMLAFWDAADALFAKTSKYVDSAHVRIAGENEFKYATLAQIADAVFPDSVPRLENGDFPRHVLYALHRALSIHDIGFRAQVRGTLRAGGEYEISSINEAATIKHVRDLVRHHQQLVMKRESGEEAKDRSKLELFAERARALIDASRERRKLTGFGSLGLSKVQTEDGNLLRAGIENGTISNSNFAAVPATDLSSNIIRFLESWAALDSINIGSNMNGLASIVLRVVDRYGDMELDKNVAWTFLQEMGIIPPWENRAGYELRLPCTGLRLQSQSAELDINDGYGVDTMKAFRKDWKDLPVYCIDDPDAHEIDDGISIESAEASGEYWVHVHVADPAAHIKMGSGALEYAERAISTTYMPDRVMPMLSFEKAGPLLSLAPDKPCLTFSAKMNLNGDILHYEITSGTIRNVVFITPKEVRKVIDEELPSTSDVVRCVGPEIPPHLASRHMAIAEELSDSNKTDFQLLKQISIARETNLQNRGGLGGITPQSLSSSLKVSFRGADFVPKVESTMAIHSRNFPGDPSIRLVTPESDVGASHEIDKTINIVQTMMLVAGEVSARWCSDRGIPVPFRVTPRNPDKMSPFEYYQKHVQHKRNADGVIDTPTLQTYMQYLGPVQPSTTPGPHANIGVDMMARCTSPLRRFTDLLLHYQVEAALKEEHRTGKSLIGNTIDDFLPFSKARVEALLPRIDTRERLISYAQRQSHKHWICQFLFRAWQSKECEIPTVMPFVVRNVDAKRGIINGMLHTFYTEAHCEIPKWTTDEMVEGTKLDVVLTDVNTYWRQIKVRSVSYYKAPEATS